jgi:MATE family multidrug resistance protein
MTSSRERGSLDAWRLEIRATGALAWPIVLTNIMQMVVLLTNTAIVGHLGTDSLAAITIGSSFYFAVQPLTFGLAFAAGPILAQARGLGQRRDASRRGWILQMRHSAIQALVALIIVTVPSWLLLWHARALLLLIGEGPTIADLASAYVRTLMWGLPLLGLFVILRGFLVATGRPRLALVAAAGQIPLNAVLCWVLVNGVHSARGLGIAGAGLASTLVNLSMVLVLLVLIERDRRLRRLGLFRASWRPDWPRLRETFRIGLPIAGHMWVEIGLFAAATLLVGRMGVLPVAAHAIAVQVAMLAYRVPMGISEASTARVGLAAGALNPAAAIKAGWGAVMLACGISWRCRS